MAEAKKEQPIGSVENVEQKPVDCDQDYVNDTLKAGFLPEGVADQLKKSSS